MRDAPDIRMTEETGYPTQVRILCCPVCGEECEKSFIDFWGNICGCENCVEEKDAEEALEDE